MCVCRSGCGPLVTTGSTRAAWCARPATSCAAPSSAPRPPPRRARTSTPSTASPAPRSPRTRARISASGSPWPRCAGCECEAAAAPQSIYMQKRNLSRYSYSVVNSVPCSVKFCYVVLLSTKVSSRSEAMQRTVSMFTQITLFSRHISS